LTIRDDDPQELDLLDDFNAAPPFSVPDGASLAVAPVTVDSDLMLPNQQTTENVLQITAGSPLTLTRTYATPQDWQDKNGLGFWYYGTASGRPVTLTLHSNRSTQTADVSPTDWQLIWSDEFNAAAGTAPNPGIWQPEIGDGFLNGIPGWGNGELEYYTDNPDNVAMDGEGNLVITAVQHDPATSPYRCWYGSCEYTSARLITWGNVEFQYGRIEARLKLPQGQGIWPAFWMLGTDLDQVGWPQSGEIDIMENIGREPATTHGTVHGPGYSGGQGIGAGYDLPNGTVADDFHIFAIEWTPDQIRWFVDEDNFFTITANDIPAGSDWVYNHPFFIILNLAVGGNWPGLPDDSSTFPQTMHIDYVRVYGAAETAERYQATFTDDFFGWNYISLPFNTFTRSTVQAEGAAETSLNLGEIWGYSLNLPHSGLFYLDKLQFE
jgi:beta-glucanase (GH16 family)